MRRVVTIAAMLGLSACGTVLPTVATGPVSTQADHAAAAAQAISEYRRSRGLPPVQVDYALMKAAEHQARAMAQSNTFSHEAGGDFAARLRSFGVRHRAAAENLSAGAADVGEVMRRWKASSGHNANLLLPQATRIGFVASEAPGTRFKRYWVLILAD
jgi:uncharacterized protein YkwD